MAVRFFNEENSFTLKNKRILSNWIQDTISLYKFKTGDINFIFTGNERILDINIQYLNHHYFTDIITFNFNNEKILSGDIYISVDTVKQNSILYSVTFLNELYRVMIHGILHLIGFNDSTIIEKSEMRELESKSLELLENKYLIK